MYALTILTPFAAWHWIIVILVVLLLFGGKKIPELMRGLGSGIKEFKDSVKEEDKTEVKKENPTTNSSNTTVN
ncbi:twin-arginine translocase TatA/TatE family subunit [Chryseobacterium caseinilyticum]|uniref:Sec-independent protein translocase protein TatA n=1 Tax=Chryseobacterium caseinilyticum TaxID=2771428 RepID=A0ABR8ZDS1_9FLAO|nr:twin-arginine translocase TatA/TatE family subunit [Chryseobacterium caseinilyticum]MBD8083416.1 twin-arginine translocase TatA/TatE family subunit [Chryseobacterium caseinilyticum]